MRSLQIFTVACLAAVIVMFFSKCKPGGSNDSNTNSGLIYNRDSAKVHFISVDNAIQLTTNFRQVQKATALRLRDSSYIVNFPLAEKFNRDAILALLDQKGAKGVRIYLGEDKKGPVKMVIVAVDSVGNDITGRNNKIMKPADNGNGGGDGVVLEAGQRCPTLCSTNSVLDN
jgi:hypothetical protein